MAGAAALGAVAGGLSGLVMTGSIKGMLEGAAIGALTAGFAKGVQWGKIGRGAVNAVETGLGVTVQTAQQVIKVLGHGVVGGLRSVRNGAKFITGFITGAVSKAITFGTQSFIKLNGITGNLTKGLIVATAGGLTSTLAGGSFELGFLTAGLAFAVNRMLGDSRRRYHRSRTKLKNFDRLVGEWQTKGSLGKMASDAPLGGGWKLVLRKLSGLLDVGAVQTRSMEVGTEWEVKNYSGWVLYETDKDGQFIFDELGEMIEVPRTRYDEKYIDTDTVDNTSKEVPEIRVCIIVIGGYCG